MSKELIRHVYRGDILTPLGDAQVTIAIKPETMRGMAESINQARKALAGMAHPIAPWQHPRPEKIIDQE